MAGLAVDRQGAGPSVAQLHRAERAHAEGAELLRSLHRLGSDWETLNFFAFVLEAVADSDPSAGG